MLGMQVATPVSVTPRDARSADFAGANITGPGPLAAGAMSFTTAVPLPANAASAHVPGAQQVPAQGSTAADAHYQGHRRAPPAGSQQAMPDAHPHLSKQRGYQGGDAALQEPSTHDASPASCESSCGMDMSPAGSGAQSPHESFRRDLPTQGIHPCAPSFAEATTPEQAPREGIAEVLTGHLHAWGKTLQRLRRPGKSPPELPGSPEPDMQPLGRAFLGQPAEPDLAR